MHAHRSCAISSLDGFAVKMYADDRKILLKMTLLDMKVLFDLC